MNRPYDRCFRVSANRLSYLGTAFDYRHLGGPEVSIFLGPLAREHCSLGAAHVIRGTGSKTLSKRPPARTGLSPGHAFNCIRYQRELAEIAVILDDGAVVDLSDSGGWDVQTIGHRWGSTTK